MPQPGRSCTDEAWRTGLLLNPWNTSYLIIGGLPSLDRPGAHSLRAERSAVIGFIEGRDTFQMAVLS